MKGCITGLWLFLLYSPALVWESGGLYSRPSLPFGPSGCGHVTHCSGPPFPHRRNGGSVWPTLRSLLALALWASIPTLLGSPYCRFQPILEFSWCLLFEQQCLTLCASLMLGDRLERRMRFRPCPQGAHSLVGVKDMGREPHLVLSSH